MTPLMYSSAPGVVKRRLRYARRFSSVDSTPIVSKRFLMVPVLSSAARIPFPSATSAAAVSCSSMFDMESPWLAVSGSIMAGLESAQPADVAQLVEHWLPKPRVAGSSPVVRVYPRRRSKAMSMYAVVDPATGETVKEYPTITDDELREGIARADRECSSATPVAARAALVLRVGELHPERRTELAEIIVAEMGKPVLQAR